MGEVESLEAHYFDLKAKLDSGVVGSDEFRSQVARLWFEDDDGHTWMIGALTGHWYVYKNDRWTVGEPPRDSAPTAMLECPRCGEPVAFDAAFCGHCGYQLARAEAPHHAHPHAGAPQRETLHPPDGTGSALSAPGLASPTDAVPAAAPRRRVLALAAGAALFGIAFLCLAATGAMVLLRGGTLPAFSASTSATPTPTSTRVVSAARITSTPTPTITPTPAPATATALVVVTIGPVPGSTGPATSGVPTPIIVFIESPTPTGTPAPTVAAPPATPTPTASPAGEPTAIPTPTANPPTPTPAPPTNTPVPRPPPPTPTPALSLSGKIAFSIFNPSYTERISYDVLVNSPDGSGRNRLAARRRQPQFSPDGSRLLVMGMENDHEKIYVQDVATGLQTEIANTLIGSMLPSWSPDGAFVLFAAADMADRQSRLYIVDARGAPESRQWLRTGTTDLIGRYPTWLPNGQIVYSGCDKWGNTGTCGIVRVNPDGGEPTMLTANERDGVDVAPAGNASTVLFMSRRDGNAEIYAVPRAGGPAQNLSNNPAEDGLPVFSPDGRSIAFVSNRSGRLAVWAMKADGSNAHELFPLEGEYASGANLDWTNERISWAP